MRSPRIRHRGRLALLAAAAGAVLALPAAASAVVIPYKLQTFPVSMEVDMDVTQTVHWKGIKAGCFAPQENVDVAYTLDYRTNPRGKRSAKLTRPGTATITPNIFGVTAGLGAPGGARQTLTSGPWVLEVAYPGGCGPDPAPPVPANIVSPKCNRIADRVQVQLIRSTEKGAKGDGKLIVSRVRKLNGLRAPAIGDPCLRLLHEVSFTDVDTDVAIFDTSTIVTVPVPKLRQRLDLLADGPAKGSRKPIALNFSFSGDCWAARVRPSIGLVSGFTQVVTQPHDVIGQGYTDGPGNNTCTLSGSGVLKLSRTGPVTGTSFVVPRG